MKCFRRCPDCEKIEARHPMEDNEIKVDYVNTYGDYSTAYVDADTGVGINKYSDEPVKVTWTGTEWIEVEA